MSSRFPISGALDVRPLDHEGTSAALVSDDSTNARIARQGRSDLGDPRGRRVTRGGVIEIVTEARSGRRQSAPAPGRRATVPSSDREPAPRRSGPAATVSAIVAVLGIGMTGVAQKERLVRAFPPSAALFAGLGLPVNLRGLAFADVHGAVNDAAAPPILTVGGRIANVRGRPVTVPPLRVAVLDKAQHELFSWTAPAPKPVLAAGETVVFRSRLAAPPEQAQELTVSFADPAAGSGGDAGRR